MYELFCRLCVQLFTLVCSRCICNFDCCSYFEAVVITISTIFSVMITMSFSTVILTSFAATPYSYC